MIFTELSIAGVVMVSTEPVSDERGEFARLFCAREFKERGLETSFVQSNLSLTRRRGTVRGLHYQVPPSEEAKLVRCIRGAIHDVVVDVRPDSPTRWQHCANTLTAHERMALYIPPGCAHGFQTLEDDSEVLYLISGYYDPDHERGLRWNDPALGISWPLPVSVVSPRDRRLPLLAGEVTR